MNNRKIIIFIILVAAVLIGSKIVRSRTSSKTSSAKSNEQISVKEPRKTSNVNREFTFPLKNEAGDDVSDFKYIVESVELRDEFIYQGKKATSVKGRTFLVLNLKLKNSYDKSIDIKTRNYIRLSVNGNRDDWFAPDIHNDPVTVQAISTKQTRLAFPVNISDSDFVLQVGQITGEKELIELDL